MNELQSAYGAKTDELLSTIFALDAGDNEPARFWCYVITACQRFAPELRQDALKWMRKAAQPSWETCSITTRHDPPLPLALDRRLSPIWPTALKGWVAGLHLAALALLQAPLQIEEEHWSAAQEKDKLGAVFAFRALGRLNPGAG